ncbi:MAG: GAF domain-containing protein, partial [Candidatus Auribacterota bacterium]|nr:GAF domain-containing protein [Candidatus Auribacterota bacterium]
MVLKKRYLKVLAVISALGLTYIVFSISVAYFHNPEVTTIKYYYYAYFAVVFYMLIICASWLFMGNIVGGIFLVISFLVAVFTLFVFHDWGFLANGIAFIFIGGILYKFWNKEHVEEYAVKMKTDDIRESTNTLIEEFNREEILEGSLDRKILRISKLREISKDIGASLSKKDLIKKVIKNTIQIIQKPGIYQLYLLGEDMRRLELSGMNIHRAKTADFTYLEEDKLKQWVFRNRQSVHIADLQQDFRFGRKYESAARSLIASPLVTGNRIMGILKISNEHPDVYSVDDLRILAIIAN